MANDDELLERVLALPEKERAELARRLLLSLEAEKPEEDASAVEQAWAEELDRRVAQIERGEVEMVSWDDAERCMRESLASERRPPKG